MNEEPEESYSDHEERRHFNRSRLIVDVFFGGQDSTGIASSKDISLGGLYMNTQAEVPEGATLLVRIPFGKHQVICSAEVVYRNPGQGLGVRFIDLSEEARTLLEQELRDG